MRDRTVQTALVTGASRGIGGALVRRLAAQGVAVGLVACDADRLAASARGLDVPHHLVAADLTDPDECRRAVAEVRAALGPIDLLVSCAGVLRRDFVEDVSVEDFERSYRLHVGAALWLSQAVLPEMRRRRRGSLVFVASELGLIGAPSYASYCVSKAGLVNLSEVLKHELVGSGVRASVICSADVRTDQLAQEIDWGPTGGGTLEEALDPDDVAATILRAVTSGRSGVVVVDRPLLRLGFRLMDGPRRMRFPFVHGAFRPLLRERRRRAADGARRQRV